MKGKELREALKARMEEEYQRDSGVRKGKKLTLILLAVWLLSRLVFLVLDLICARIGFTPFSPTNIAAFAVSLFFALLLFRGAGKLALLPLLGSVMMLANVFRQNMPALLALDLDYVLRLYILAYLLAAVVQLLVMLLLLFLPACRAYAEASQRAANACRTQSGPRL